MRKIICFLFIISSQVLICQNSVLHIDSTLDAPFFHSEKLLFPKWVIHNRKKQLINSTTGKKIKAGDSISLKTPASSLALRYSDKADGIFPDTIMSVESRAFLSGDTLNLLFAYQATESEDIVCVALAPVIQAYIVEGTPKKKELTGERVLLRNLTLKKKNYNKGEWLYAALDFSIEYDLNDVARGPYHQKIYYKGWMKCRVE